MKIIVRMLTVLLLTGLVLPASAAPQKNAVKYRSVSLLWFIGGTQNLYPCEVPPTDKGTTAATCHNHPVLDLRTNKIIGFARDATNDVEQIGTGLVATGTTTFNINGLGTLTVRGRGTIQPVLVENSRFTWRSSAFQGERPTPITNIAGIFPNPKQQNMILSGTGAFKGARGKFALLGALDLSNAQNNRDTFNCLYKIDIQVPVSQSEQR